jgi:hypothetical protein
VRSSRAVSGLARRALAAAIARAHTRGMPNPGRVSLGEALITTTLLSIYVGSRGTAMAIAAAQTSPARCAGAAAALRGRTSHLARRGGGH